MFTHIRRKKNDPTVRSKFARIRICMKYTFLAHWQAVLPRPWVFSRPFGCGACKWGACTLAASLVPGRAPWRVLWGFKVERAGFVSRDRLPPSQSQAGPWKPHNSAKYIFDLLLLFHTVPPVLKFPTLRQPRYNSRTSGSPFCDRYGRHFCVCV